MKIIKVDIVSGSELKPSWKNPMQKIFIEGLDGFLVATAYEGINWSDFIGKEINNLETYPSSGYDWPKINSFDIVDNLTDTHKLELDKKENDYFKDFRKKYPANYRTTDGHYVRSKAEAMIDDYLYNSKIVHIYEKKLPILEDVYSDFFIPSIKGSEPVYLEYWGLVGDEDYDKRKNIKQSIYNQYNYNLIELDDKHIENLDDHLPILLMKFGLKFY